MQEYKEIQLWTV